MPIKILMPALSPTMTEGNIAKWTKKEGDIISAGDIIAEIETDKATMEVEAVDEGILAKIVIPQGANNVAVNSLIAVLIDEDEKDADIDSFIKKFDKTETKTIQLEEKNDTKSPKEASKNDLEDLKSELTKNPSDSSDIKNRIFASPLAKRIAGMEGVSLTNIDGSGPHGRIIKADILKAIKTGVKASVQRVAEEYKAVPNNNMRKIIAKRLLDSKITIPHFYLSIECMMDQLLSARSQINNTLVGDDKLKKISVNDFIILASAKALNDVPQANASWSEEAVLIYNNVDISVAVAIDGGLITPIIKNADQKDITKISAEMKDLAKRARANNLTPEEFQGGGFTISNLGMYGIKNFSAIINPPQGCIMSVGMSSKRTVVIDNKIEIKTVMDVTISCDHRVIDGAVGAQFLSSFKKYIESPILMFI